MSEVTLHGYWRSSASYRVRLALAFKGVAYASALHDLRTGEQKAEAYLAIAPHGLVPALEHGGTVLIESPAILEWIETRWPEPALLPSSPEDAATVRAMSALIACDIHPLQNLRVLKALKKDFGASQEQTDAWAARWIGKGFRALETLIERHGGAYAFGDSPTLADCYLVPQVYNARRLGVDLADFLLIKAVDAAVSGLPIVSAAHPDRQPDADR